MTHTLAKIEPYGDRGRVALHAARARPFDLDPEALLRDGGVAEVSVDCDNP